MNTGTNVALSEQAAQNITREAVRAQVARILTSEAFLRSRRMQRFLEFIVEETLAGRGGQIGEYVIGVEVFDRGADFEPALDPVVRNDARRLRFKLFEFYRQACPGSEAVLIDIPKGGYVPVFRPFPARAAEANAEPSASPEPVPAEPRRRLAVLPFEVLSETSENAFCSRALCMSLTANLTNLEGLEAVAHSYLHDRPIRETAAEMQLSHVIHGSISNSSGRCRIVVNLVHVPHGTQMWAREYDFETSEMLDAHSEISASVSREVTTRLGLEPPQARALATVFSNAPARRWNREHTISRRFLERAQTSSPGSRQRSIKAPFVGGRAQSHCQQMQPAN